MPYILIKMKPITSEGIIKAIRYFLWDLANVCPTICGYFGFGFWGPGLWAFGLDVDYLGFVLFI